MAIVKKSIKINAPAEKIYKYFNTPTNLPEIWPSMAEIKDVERLPNGGNKFTYVYNMAGLRFEGTSEDIEVIPNRKVVSKSEGGIESTITREVMPEAEGSNVTFEAEYVVPVPLLGKLAEAVIVKLNENEVNALLANLKVRMET